MSDIQKLKDLAAQLAQPSAEKGVEMGEMMNRTNIKMTRQAISLLDIQPYDHILELGHGNAGHLAELFAQQPNIRYTGLETSPTMQQEATRINQALVDQGKASFMRYDGATFPLAQGSCNKIFSVNCVYFWEDPLAQLQKQKELLAADGRLIISFAMKEFMQTLPFTAWGFRLYDVEDMTKLLTEAGFSDIAVHQDKENVISKAGDAVERQFASIVASVNQIN